VDPNSRRTGMPASAELPPSRETISVSCLLVTRIATSRQHRRCFISQAVNTV